MSRFFIDRPIFAWVVALFISLADMLAIPQVPVAQYPSVAPPSIEIYAVIDHAMQAGELPAEFDAQAAAGYFNAVLAGAIGNAMFYPESLPLGENAARVVGVSIDALCRSSHLRVIGS